MVVFGSFRLWLFLVALVCVVLPSASSFCSFRSKQFVIVDVDGTLIIFGCVESWAFEALPIHASFWMYQLVVIFVRANL